LAAAAALIPEAGEWVGAPAPEIDARFALSGEPVALTAVRHARPVPLASDVAAEAAAVAVLRECTAQVRANVTALRAGAGSDAPHQLRIGLRRLRAALGLFRGVIGGSAADRLADDARWLAGEVGRLRDLDVMREDVVRPEAAAHPDEPGFARLADALRTQGDRTRADLCRTLAGDRVQRFLIDIVAFTECAGWQAADRLNPDSAAAPGARTVGIAALDRRWRKVVRMAKDIDRMDTEARHALRKELKKLRYGVEFLGPLFRKARVAAFVTRLKALQEVFGTLNDAATAAALLSGPDAPAPDDPAAARAAGRVIGARIVRAERDWIEARTLWTKLDRTPPFWRDPA
jgi:CHAD domain-containing protein